MTVAVPRLRLYWAGQNPPDARIYSCIRCGLGYGFAGSLGLLTMATAMAVWEIVRR